jgi:ribosomal protein L20
MEVTIHENFRLTKLNTWIARIWQIPDDFGRSYQHTLEHLERRVVALEQKVRSDPLASRNQNPPSTKQ